MREAGGAVAFGVAEEQGQAEAPRQPAQALDGGIVLRLRDPVLAEARGEAIAGQAELGGRHPVRAAPGRPDHGGRDRAPVEGDVADPRTQVDEADPQAAAQGTCATSAAGRRVVRKR